MTGRQLLAILRRLPTEELELPVDVLVEQYDQPTCRDCGRHHASPWEAIACDEFLAARARRLARAADRRRQLADQAATSTSRASER